MAASKRKQILTDSNSSRFAIIKTFVTTPMMSRIAESYGIRCVNTPTGFKWMAEKLAKYEREAMVELKEKEGLSLDFEETELFARIDVLSRYSTFVILAAEESYGYLPLDVVRDKDGNVIGGSMTDAIEAHDVWTFQRDLTSNDPNWTLVETATV